MINRIQRKWMKIRLQPIQVFCLHHVCAEFNPEAMNACDWMQIDEFKNKIITMQQAGIEFISLNKAYELITNDKFRRAKFAVLTFDDGYASLKEILPWLEKQHIPSTLFINGNYCDGKTYRNNPKEKYITKEELFHLTSPLIEIGSHGWVHVRATEQILNFGSTMAQNIDLLSKHPRYIPFHAYTYGDHDVATDEVLNEMGVMPVLIDGMKNYNDIHYIHRELL